MSKETKEGLKYQNRFGFEASVEDLKDASGYDVDSIWLFSVELFHKELLKFNMKFKARNAQDKRDYEEEMSKINRSKKS